GIVRWLELNGFIRASTVREAGEYAVRGGIIDLFPPPPPYPPPLAGEGREGVRLDFFGDTLESIRTFDPETQRSADQLRALNLVPVAEFQLTTETIRRFRTGYVQAFGATTPDDLLYEAVSEGRRYPGMEHWLPLFHDGLDTLFDYVAGTPIAVEPLAEDAAHERCAQIADYYDARRQDLAQGAEKGAGLAYKPLPPDRLYLGEAEWRERLDTGRLVRLVPFAAPEGATAVIDAGTRQGRNFAPERAQPDANVFDAVKDHVNALQSAKTRLGFALWSDGARDRMSHVLADHALLNLVNVQNWPEALARPAHEIALAVLGLEFGFEVDGLAVIGEQDILGDRLVRPRRGSKRAENFIAEVSALSAGDLVVH